MVLAVVNVGHILILQALCQFHQRSFSLKKIWMVIAAVWSLYERMCSWVWQLRERLTCFSCCLVFPMWFVQNVGATSHSEIVVDLSEPSAKKKMTWAWLEHICTTEVFRETLQAVYFYRISVALPVKGPNLISSKGGWKPRICRASSWEMGGRLEMKIYIVSVSAASKGAVCKTFSLICS